MEEVPFGLGVLVGLELTIARRAANLRNFQFGPVRTTESKYSSGRVLVVGQYALHIQCPWRLERREGIVTGSSDLYQHAGPQPEPEGWTYDAGNSLDDLRLDEVFGPLHPLGNGFHYASGAVVTGVTADAVLGDLAISLSNLHVLRVFPSGSNGEEWRFFAPGADADHVVFGDDP